MILGDAAAQTAYLEKDHSKEEVREQYDQLVMEVLYQVTALFRLIKAL